MNSPLSDAIQDGGERAADTGIARTQEWSAGGVHFNVTTGERANRQRNNTELCSATPDENDLLNFSLMRVSIADKLLLLTIKKHGYEDVMKRGNGMLSIRLRPFLVGLGVTTLVSANLPAECIGFSSGIGACHPRSSDIVFEDDLSAAEGPAIHYGNFVAPPAQTVDYLRIKTLFHP